MAKKIKAPKPKAKASISAKDTKVNYDEKPPVFSLERLQNGDYCLQGLDKEGKASFADAIFRRKDKKWKDIKQMPKHGLGFEKLPKLQLKLPFLDLLLKILITF